MTAAFTGFSPEALHFLLELSIHNDRSWFQPRKAEYERLLKEPLEALCLAVGERFAKRKIPLTADQRSPFRIYRDVRFSKDKSPYKTYVSASFPGVGDDPVHSHSRTQAVHRPGGYFSFSPDNSYVGGGMWQPDRPRLDAWRRLVDAEPKRVHAIIDAPALTAAFGELDAESRLKRVPPGYPADHRDAELLKLKDVLFGRRLTDDEVLSADLPDTIADTFATASPLLRLLDSLPA
ncbi:MAG TPA: DUF2461 domain-containing protein [Candidatus Limnocylindrales bacterium]